jgi:signal peptidase I
MRPFHRQILITVLVGIGIFALFQTTIQSFVVVGDSMEPSFEDGQRLIVNKAIYRLDEPHRGDVIVFCPPISQHADFIKRIIALPGDTVEIKEGTVYINDIALDESYTKAPPSYTYQEEKVPEGEYFVLGDNRNNSNDSHSGWTVSRKDIVGKAWLSIWPASKWGFVPNQSLQEQLASAELPSELP